MRNKIIFYILLLIPLIISCKSSAAPTGKGSGQEGFRVESNSPFNFFNKKAEDRELTPIEYVQWIRDEKNGLKIRKQEGIYMYELQYQPVEYLVILQERSEEITASTLKKEMEKRGDLQYFTFKMSSTKGKGILSDEDLVIENKDIYLLSGLQQDIMLVEDQDTLKCVMLHFEASNNLVPYDQCVLAFEEPRNPKADITFLYRTEKYTGGWVEISVKRENINKISKLKTI
jgi:hypothetical protein